VRSGNCAIRPIEVTHGAIDGRYRAVVPPDGVAAVLVTGGLGVGKTAVSAAVGDLLEAQGDSGCVIDLDWLCWAWAPALDSADLNRLLCDNLRSVMPRLLAEQLSRVVLCRGMTDAEHIDAVRSAVGVPVRTVRLTATPEEVQARLRRRETGVTLSRHLA
jgi:hypothetical protein